jgi:hypothetical protein
MSNNNNSFGISNNNNNSFGTLRISGGPANNRSGSFVRNRSGASANNSFSSLPFGESFIGTENWFGYSHQYIRMMHTFQKDILRSNSILSIVDEIFSEVFDEHNENIIPNIFLKFILYSQLNPCVPFTKIGLGNYLRTFFGIFKDKLLIPILFMPDNVISRIIVTITLGLLHETAYLLTLNFLSVKKDLTKFAIYAPDSIKIASLFTEAFYVFGLNQFVTSFHINLPDCGDAISFLMLDDGYIEARLIEAKLARKGNYGLEEKFLNPELDTYLFTKPVNKNMTNGINKKEARISLPEESQMVITKTTGVYLAKGFFLQPNNKKSDEFVLEFQNLSRTSEDIGAEIIERDQLRLVINTSKSKIIHIFEEVKRLFLFVRCPNPIKPKFYFQSFFKKLEKNPKRNDDDDTLKGASFEAMANI